MGISARRRALRFNRVMAIALASGLAVSGVQVVNTTSPFGAPVAIAQDNTAIPAKAVTVEGLFDGEGNKVTTDYDALAKGNIDNSAGYQLRLNVDMSKVSKDGKIDVFFGAAEQPHSGGGIAIGEADANFGIEGGLSDVLNIKKTSASFGGGKVASGITITGLDNADNITSGTVPITVPVRIVANFYGAGDGVTQGAEGQSPEWKDQPVKYWTRTADGNLSAPDATPFGFNISYRQIVSGVNDNDSKYQSWTMPVYNKDADPDNVHLMLRGITPVNTPNGTAAVTYHPKNDGLNDDDPWEFTDPSKWEATITKVSLISGSQQSPLTEEQKNAVKLEVVEDDGGFRVIVSNIPKDARVTYEVREIGLVPANKTAQYRLAPSKHDPAVGGVFGRANSAANVVDPNASVDAESKPAAKVLINGKEWTEEEPFKFKPGEEIELEMELSQEGNTRLSHPTITNEAGEVVAEDAKVTVEAGKPQTLKFKYTPTKDDSELKFKVTYANDKNVEASTWVATSGCDCTVDYQGEEKPIQEVIDDLNKRLENVEKENGQLKDQLGEAEQAIKDLEQADKDQQAKLEDADKRITALEGRLNTGLGRCVGAIGGSLLFILPAIAIASQLLGGMRIAAIDEFVAQSQKQLGIWDPRLAKIVNDNRGAIAAGVGGLSLLTLALIPGLCGEASLGKAATEQLSSKKDA
ncbi:hypothetical protein [uncultured Corynebacterium sp.]|uniref:hypothetical protein n=1 Tax=uncultured Corynebacterium sp. TaxID=159447 RepID=UPI00261B5C0B|nr:hypothetical protein [uncultured Corynebacterium sp.]